MDGHQQPCRLQRRLLFCASSFPKRNDPNDNSKELFNPNADRDRRIGSALASENVKFLFGPATRIFRRQQRRLEAPLMPLVRGNSLHTSHESLIKLQTCGVDDMKSGAALESL